MAQAAVERKRRQEDRSAKDNLLNLFSFFLPLKTQYEPRRKLGKIFQQIVFKVNISFKSRLKRSQTPLEGSLKTELKGEKSHFLN